MKIQLTQETIIKTRKQLSDWHLSCIDDVKSGKIIPNNPATYIKWMEKCSADCLSGKEDNTFTFQQRAVYIQTGEEIPFLPK